ncbi:MAG: hypothetical protein AAF333_11455 [Planctomycetota bacterium]
MAREEPNKCWISRCVAMFFAIASIVLMVIWLWTRFTYGLDRQLAVYSTADLTQQYLAHFNQHNAWPEPGEIVGNRGVTYVDSPGPADRRTDRFRLAGRHLIHVDLNNDGTLRMHLYREKE